MFSNKIPIDRNNKAQLDKLRPLLKGYNFTLEQFLDICELNGAVIYEKLQPESVRFTDFPDTLRDYNQKELNELSIAI